MAYNLNLFNQIFSRLVSSAKSQINRVTKWTLKIQNFTNLAGQKIQEKINKYIQLLFSKPKSKNDYWKFFDIYFSKRFIIMSFIVVGGILFIFSNLVYPFLDGRLWYSKININTQKYSNFSGKAKVYDLAKNLIYQGELSNGQASGYGIQYRSNGKLLYKGNFNLDKYNGEGQLYNEYENIIYRGFFENNKFHGQGQQISNLGVVLYFGSFESGLKSGRGTEFDPKTRLKCYYGEYKNNLREGKGIEYEADGESVKYEGEYKLNKFDGNGKLYLYGHMIYNGDFKNGLYEGSGTLYEKGSGVIEYIGEFKEGAFDGNGKLFKSMRLVFEGNFSDGKRNGKGTAFDLLGTSIYEGNFRNDGIDYVSILGKNSDFIKESFKDSDLKKDFDNKRILLYTGVKTIFLIQNPEDQKNYCDKVFIDLRNNDFMGISDKSNVSDLNSVLGNSYSSTNFELKEININIFKLLNISLNNSLIKTIKYVYDGYYFRVYFNDDFTNAVAIEIGKTNSSLKEGD